MNEKEINEINKINEKIDETAKNMWAKICEIENFGATWQGGGEELFDTYFSSLKEGIREIIEKQ